MFFFHLFCKPLNNTLITTCTLHCTDKHFNSYITLIVVSKHKQKKYHQNNITVLANTTGYFKLSFNRSLHYERYCLCLQHHRCIVIRALFTQQYSKLTFLTLFFLHTAQLRLFFYCTHIMNYFVILYFYTPRDRGCLHNMFNLSTYSIVLYKNVLLLTECIVATFFSYRCSIYQNKISLFLNIKIQ